MAFPASRILSLPSISMHRTLSPTSLYVLTLSPISLQPLSIDTLPNLSPCIHTLPNLSLHVFTLSPISPISLYVITLSLISLYVSTLSPISLHVFTLSPISLRVFTLSPILFPRIQTFLNISSCVHTSLILYSLLNIVTVCTLYRKRTLNETFCGRYRLNKENKRDLVILT